jgi:S-adenosyl-L-methionine hydrolase (adenosine-forming)
MTITITTDFGNRDGFVGIMRGVMQGIAPQVNVIDISNEIEPGDIAAGAWILANAYEYFPQGTVHLAIVDPGVGSSRKGLIVSSRRYTFVAPDNGLLTYVLNREGPVDCYAIDQSSFWRKSVSFTFHGRDIFAPVAAHLAAGQSAANMGSPIDFETLVRLPDFAMKIGRDTADGVIVYVDRFGNLISNIPASALESARHCAIAGQRIDVGRTYSSVQPGQPVAIGGSHGYVEVGVNGGSAAQIFEADVGTPVVLSLE